MFKSYRKGKIYFNQNHDIEEVSDILGYLKFVPLRVEFLAYSNEFEYIGISDKFEELQIGEKVPTYTITLKYRYINKIKLLDEVTSSRI